jgi:hypothetical protein
MNVNLVRIGLLSAVLAGSTGPVAIQPATNLSALTVPEDRLPPGCRLKPAAPRAAGTIQGSVVAVSGERSLTPTNPWSGSDRRLAAAIRQRVDGVPEAPDGPPLDRRASAAYALKWADHVVEAYRATYQLADESVIDLAAVRFDDQTLARPTPPPGTRSVRRGVNSRVVLGSSVVLISAGAASSCFAAIGNYVRSLR